MATTITTEESEKAQARSISIINFLIGVWMIISPFILGYSTNGAYWSQIITGVIVALASLARMAMPRMAWPSWINGIAGIWLIISPFVIGYNTAAGYWNSVIFGIILAVLGFANIGTVHHRAGHPAH